MDCATVQHFARVVLQIGCAISYTGRTKSPELKSQSLPRRHFSHRSRTETEN
jgi:hypothetical protein